MEHLTQEARNEFLAEHPDWTLDGETISRRFMFDGFADAIAFVTKVAMAAEVADHHPDIDIRWNKVTLTLTTHSEKALTTNDTELAAKADSFVG